MSTVYRFPENPASAKRAAAIRRAEKMLKQGNRLKYTRGPKFTGPHNDGPSAA